MSKLFLRNANPEAFLKRAVAPGYSMQEELVRPWVGLRISGELESAGILVDYTELESTDRFEKEGMTYAHLLHKKTNAAISRVTGNSGNHIPEFSVRVFEPGEHGTTIHRNDPCIGPWAVGFTLRGSAPFNVYSHDQLDPGTTTELKGDGTDPTPLESMDARVGSGWTLYTPDQQVPHSSGLVEADSRRELLIFYGQQW